MVSKPKRVIKGYKFRMYPSETQKEALNATFGACRYVWNFMLDVKKNAYLELGVNLNYYDTARGLTEIKKIEGSEFLSKVNSQSIQSELRKLDVAYLRFYKKLGGFPKFKSKRDKQSFTVPQFFKYADGKLKIPKLKTPIEVVQSREFGKNFEILFVTISRNKVGKYFVAFTVEEGLKEPKAKVTKQIGIDLGLTDLMTFSDETKVKNPKITKKFRKKLEYKYRQLSKKCKGSKNREKSRFSLAKTFDKISNIKLDFTHKLTSKIVSENQVIVLEDLSVANMMKNHKLARSIQEVSWNEIVRQLKYKSEWNGRDFVQVDRFFPSSKTCSNDGFVIDKLPLNVREWTCPKCGVLHDRDVNAARNILNQGLKILSGFGTKSDTKQKHGEALKKFLEKSKENFGSVNHESPRSLA